MTNKTGSGRGGRREGSGRKKGEPTVVKRIKVKHWERIHDGTYDKVFLVLYNKRALAQINCKNPTSPRWQRIIELFNELDLILGDDPISWLN